VVSDPLIGSDAATGPTRASPWLPLRLLPTCLAQLAIDTTRLTRSIGLQPTHLLHDTATFRSRAEGFQRMAQLDITLSRLLKRPSRLCGGRLNDRMTADEQLPATLDKASAHDRQQNWRLPTQIVVSSRSFLSVDSDCDAGSVDDARSNGATLRR